MHEDLFRATALSSTETFAPLGKIANPLIGINVKLPDTCKHCASDLSGHRRGAGPPPRITAL